MLIDDDTRKILTDIVKGIVLKGKEDHCTTTRNLLCASFSTSTTVKRDFESQSRIKKEQADFLKRLASEKDLWVKEVPNINTYLTRGGESQIYFASDKRSVIKVNDGIYYATWLEFFNSIVIHNLLCQYALHHRHRLLHNIRIVDHFARIKRKMVRTPHYLFQISSCPPNNPKLHLSHGAFYFLSPLSSATCCK